MPRCSLPEAAATIGHAIAPKMTIERRRFFLKFPLSKKKVLSSKSPIKTSAVDGLVCTIRIPYANRRSASKFPMPFFTKIQRAGISIIREMVYDSDMK